MSVTVRKMMRADIDCLRLEEAWMYDKYRGYFDCQTGPAWVACDEKGILCAFGAAFLWPGVCEVWFNLVRAEKTIAQIRAVKKTLDEQAVVYEVRRYQANTRCCSKIDTRFCISLGFKIEGIMKRYDHAGRDCYMLARMEGN